MHNSHDFPKCLARNYGYLETIRIGGYGQEGIFKARSKTTGENVVLKVMHPPVDGWRLNFLRYEAEMLNRISHRNVVGFRDFSCKPIPHLCIEYFEGLDLDKIRLEYPLLLAEEMRARFTHRKLLQ